MCDRCYHNHQYASGLECFCTCHNAGYYRTTTTTEDLTKHG